MLTSNNINHTNCLGYMWDDEIEKMLGIVESRIFKCEGERNNHMLHYGQVFGNIFKRRESKCCGVLMKHRC